MSDLERSVPIRAATVDLWFTLIRDDPATGKLRRDARMAALGVAFGELGWEIDEQRLEAAYERCGESHAKMQISGRDLAIDDHIALFLGLLQPPKPVTEEEFARIRTAYVDAALVAPPTPIPGAQMMLESLRAAGLPLALISNAGRTPGVILRRFMQDLGLAQYFAYLIFSDEVRLAKPNPAIFALALAHLGVRADEAVHIGDDLVLDRLGAQRAGMRAILVCAECPPDLEPPHRWAPDPARVPELLGVATATPRDGEEV